MVVSLLRFLAFGWLFCTLGYFALMPIAFGVAWLTIDDRPAPRYLNQGYTR